MSMRLPIFLSLLSSAILLVTISGCNKSRVQDSSHLLEELDTIQWTIIQDREILPIARDMTVTDSTILLLGLINGKWIHEYDRNSGTPIGSHIIQGQGPGEIVNATILSKNSENSFSVFDINEQRVKLFDTDSHAQIETIGFKTVFPTMWEAYELKENRFLVKAPSSGESGLPVRSFSILNTETMQIEDTYDKLPEEFMEEPLMLMVQSDLAISPDGKHFVSVTTRGGTIEIFNIQGNHIQEIFSAIPFPVNFIESNGIKELDSNNVLGFISVDAADAFWIASYCGTSNDADANKFGIWDWTGQPINRFITDHTIFKIAISPDSKTLYGLLIDKDGDFVIGKISLEQTLSMFDNN